MIQNKYHCQRGVQYCTRKILWRKSIQHINEYVLCIKCITLGVEGLVIKEQMFNNELLIV